MKVYSKPEFYVEEFQLNNAVLACDPETVTETNVLVNCLIKSGQEMVFYTGCNYVATNAELKSVDANTIDGYSTEDKHSDFSEKQYFYWYGSADGTPSAGGVYDIGDSYNGGTVTETSEVFGALWGNVLMNWLVSLGISKTNGNKQVLHAGLANPSITSIVNHSV